MKIERHRRDADRGVNFTGGFQQKKKKRGECDGLIAVRGGGGHNSGRGKETGLSRKKWGKEVRGKTKEEGERKHHDLK